MTNLVPANMENIFLLLSQYNFTTINNDIDNFKCAICGRIITNAYQAICGCNYCHKCVDESLRNGDVFCPGITEFCQSADLLNVAPDHKMNLQISQLIVKCPEQACDHESQLRAMGGHLRFCQKRSVECPFNDVGCDGGKLALDQLEEHLQQKSLRHSELLIEVIGNLRNEIAELKRDGEKYRSDINRLVQCDTEKGAMIDSMKKEVRLIKLENAALERRVENLLEGKCDKTAMEIDARCLREKIDSIDEQLREMRREWSGEKERMAMADNEKKQKEKEYQIEMTQRICIVEKDLAENMADFVWPIENITEWRKNPTNILSEYFKGCPEPYKMRLLCYLYRDTELQIILCIYASNSDEFLRWPFNRNVTITIANRRCPKMRKSATNLCTVAKPTNTYYQTSGQFKFDWKEVIGGGMLKNDRLTVQCFVHDG